MKKGTLFESLRGGTKTKVAKGMASLVTLKGLLVDRAFLDTCLHLWDPQAHVFRFGTHYEEMCPTYEEFTALLGSDSERAPVAAPTGTGYFKSFIRMLGLSVMEARELVVDDQDDLSRLIERYLDLLDFVDLEHQRFWTRAIVFCLVSTCILTSSIGRTVANEAQWMAEHGDWERERERIATLTREIDARLQVMTGTTLPNGLTQRILTTLRRCL
ncbi:hypothetical protein JCGZ_06399 [Jatropha curcas]|uniref:Aminotransferase-like plant mobile domain-containing protein n=1 Tax=Jatropha curcas TaxID=180498 RepID=A0A067L169_JATCU|nr:hypothetical protein JCGZ_06399 [Jatropha curcas]